MSIAFSIVPVGYDIDFIARYCGITVLGQAVQQDGTTQITYRNPDGSGNFTMVSQTIENYTVEYLPVALSKKIEDIRVLRNQKIQSFTFGGMKILLDLETKANIVGSVIGLDKNPDVPGLDWSLGNGEFVFLPRATLYQLATASFMYVENCFSQAKALIAQCKACTDIIQLAAVDITIGWPQSS